MNGPETAQDPQALRRVGARWRVAGVALVLVAALVIVVARGLGRDLRSLPMIAGFSILALGWMLAFVGVWLRLQRTRSGQER